MMSGLVQRSSFRHLMIVGLTAIFLVGCAATAKHQWNTKYGVAHPTARQAAVNTVGPVNYETDVKPILEHRCAVCHACYDAPCQLKTTAIEGMERGASKSPVYQATRLGLAEPSRLFEDANTVDEWRKRGFFPVLNERDQDPETNRNAGLLYRFLALKEEHPLPEGAILPEDFTLGIGRENSCPIDVEFEQFAERNPLWGMPYALPQLSEEESGTLKRWLEMGAQYQARPKLPGAALQHISQWEAWLNQQETKQQLVSRYIYEHLYLNNLYFDDLNNRQFYRLVRSSTGPGQPVQQIATRRPFDDPGVERVFYRLIPYLETIVGKTHNPYVLNEARRLRWRDLFEETPFEVTRLPGYTKPKESNPFVVFAEIPANSRYRFMLEESKSTIMNFIKGPVCRGQVAVNVIRDHFWVFFLDPDGDLSKASAKALEHSAEKLALTNTDEGLLAPLLQWTRYAKNETRLREGRDEFMRSYFQDQPLDLNLVWDGDGNNPNAALTIYRHFDTASVHMGLIGAPPKTAWVIDYTLLERIHYLLVADYDVYGRVGHHLVSRLHMDFLRMEGEAMFLSLLPQAAREAERKNWYRQAPQTTLDYLTHPKFEASIDSSIDYFTNNPKRELFTLLQTHLAAVLPTRHQLSALPQGLVKQELQRLNSMRGLNIEVLADATFLRIIGESDDAMYVTLLRNDAHLNMTSVFDEDKRRVPAENTLSVLPGLIGEHPNAFMEVSRSALAQFVDEILALKSADDYLQLMTRYGIRRTNQRFWAHSDTLHKALEHQDPVAYGLLDFNRLENR